MNSKQLIHTNTLRHTPSIVMAQLTPLSMEIDGSVTKLEVLEQSRSNHGFD
jgi:hypothetical protein